MLKYKILKSPCDSQVRVSMHTVILNLESEVIFGTLYMCMYIYIHGWYISYIYSHISYMYMDNIHGKSYWLHYTLLYIYYYSIRYIAIPNHQ